MRRVASKRWLTAGGVLGKGVRAAVGDCFCVVGAAIRAHDERKAARGTDVRLGEKKNSGQASRG